MMAYGYNQKPAIMEMKYAIEALAKEEDLIKYIMSTRALHRLKDIILE